MFDTKQTFSLKTASLNSDLPRVSQYLYLIIAVVRDIPQWRNIPCVSSKIILMNVSSPLGNKIVVIVIPGKSTLNPPNANKPT